jgi:3-isopropylmalate/(R)-2-methylmalate dehydratase small subunit
MSKPFRRLTGVAAPLPLANVDTDMILPAGFMKTVSREGLGRGMFHRQRFDEAGIERPDFILNREPWRQARILVALDNFGCGSSREHAPWALLDFGISCIIAPSFAEIFEGNCFKNGMLPVTLARGPIKRLISQASDPATATFSVDLEAEEIVAAGVATPFEIEPKRRTRLLEGADDIEVSLRFVGAIERHEARVRAETPWLNETHMIAR